MLTPTFTEVMELRDGYNLIPITYSFLADQATPIQIYQTIRGENTFLLESVEDGNRWGRFSFIGLNPFLRFRAKNEDYEVSYRDGFKEQGKGNPVAILKEKLSYYHIPRLINLPPFAGGAVGFLGYDTVRYVEELPDTVEDDLQLDTLHLLFVDELIAYDHLRQEVKVIVNIHIPEDGDEDEIRRLYDEAGSRVMALVKRIIEPVQQTQKRIENIPLHAEMPEFTSNMTKEEFCNNVKQAKEYIASGDIFQVVLSQRFSTDTEVDPLLVYRILRVTNPSPYMYYFETDGMTVAGASPEMLVKVTGDKVETRPIAGTRPRGKTEEEDLALAEELLADEKERAEHIMLVDLGRNDVGRVSRYGTVNVDEQMVIELYSKVMHIVSHVSGRLKEDISRFDALLSCFPAGTLSGSPKIRAMEIIDELENKNRGVYGGAIGYFSFQGNLDSCITIRTIVFKDKKAYVQAGAGIVADSVPELEYEETVNKARAMLIALGIAEKMNQKEELSLDV